MMEDCRNGSIYYKEADFIGSAQAPYFVPETAVCCLESVVIYVH
jgi:hypothetical protein